MNKSEALKEARRRFGKDALIEDKGWEHASDPISRQTARAEALDISERIKILKARQEELGHAARKFQYSIGKVVGVAEFRAFHVTAEGDSWEACFDELDRKANVIKDELKKVAHAEATNKT
jgi:hypothetical protein